MPQPSTTANITSLRERGNDCGSCRLNALCLPVRLKTEDKDTFSKIVQRPRPLSRGQHLFQNGAPFRSVYAVRTGAVKLSHLSSDGVEHVSGFRLPGEIIGLDALDFEQHPSSAVALDTTALCEIPFDRLEALAEEIPGLMRQLVRMVSHELHSEQELAQALATRSADERLALVLLSLSERHAQRGLSATRFALPMSRHDLANYLGLAPETMSRLFKRLEGQGLLSTEGKEVSLLDLPALRRLAAQPEESKQPTRLNA